MSEVFNLGRGNWAGRYSKMLAYKVDNGNYIANELNFTRTTTGTFVNQNGFIEEQELRVPRVDYSNNSNGTLLLEPQRTNLITYSEDFSQWGTLGADVVEYVSTLQNPDGLLGGYKVKGSGIYLSASLSATTQRSIYARSVSGSGDVQLMTHNSNTNNIFTLTEQWQRFDLNSVTSSTGESSFYIDLRGSSTTLSELYVWGAMAETGSFPTSYIPSTSGTSVTRAYDYFSGSFEEVTTQGTIFIDFEQLTQSQLNYRFRSPSYNVSYGFYFYGGGMDVYNGSAFMVDRTTLEPDNSKVAVSWNGTNVKVFINGNNRTKSNAVASIYTTSRITFQDSNDIANLNEVKVYNTELTDEELITLTT